MSCFTLGIRGKLITIFVLIKVLPLIVLAWFAWNQILNLNVTVKNHNDSISEESYDVVEKVTGVASLNSIHALDLKSRETIERLTTDTARAVADFLHQRDRDILLVSQYEPKEAVFRRFLLTKKRPVIEHGPWVMDEEGKSWMPSIKAVEETDTVTSRIEDNSRDFHYRPPEKIGISVEHPLYLEMTYVDLTGNEKVKVTTSHILPGELKDISKRENTYCKAENYFEDLKRLKPGEIYVSEVIGPYVKAHMVGTYNKIRAAKTGRGFAPEESGYAGKENPVGRRFQGLIRWASPFVSNGKITGYVTLALDHTHLMEFTDHIVPTEERYSPISDAGSGNYAFMWDYKSRNISHPRDYFIVGYDPDTGEQALPWMDPELYQVLRDGNLSMTDFQKTAPIFKEPSLKKRPERELTQAGLFALDGRYLNFAPQCAGWHNLTQHGGSGSFLIFWSGLWKLTTAATIPYYTGNYGKTPRGFGYVTIGANVDEFHRAATDTAKEIGLMGKEFGEHLERQNMKNQETMNSVMRKTSVDLTLYTTIMILLVIIIAIWMASALTKRITKIIKGIKRFQQGDKDYHLQIRSQDEMGQLATAFNEMSTKITQSIRDLEEARETAECANHAKSDFLANMSHELRTPLNHILGFTELVVDKTCGELNETQEEYLNDVLDSGRHLLCLINDILDISKVESGKSDLELMEVNPKNLLENSLTMVKEKAMKHEIELSTDMEDIPDTITADERKLKQIIFNLLSNAVKFVPEGGSVNLSAGRLSHVNGHWTRSDGSEVSLPIKDQELFAGGGDFMEISVADTGIGIKEENLSRIFNPFEQVDGSSTRAYQGTGLGLSLSKNFVELHNGRIWAESEGEGKGATFRFVIPV